MKNKNDSTTKLRLERLAWCREIKASTPCTDCKQLFRSELMDFDHIGDNKSHNIAHMINQSRYFTIEKTLEEMAKCEIVCCYCHNIRTEKRFAERREAKIAAGNYNEPNAFVKRNYVIIHEAKSKPCVRCGIQYGICNMQLDHISPQPEDLYICNMWYCKEAVLRAELTKCQPMCAGCHRLQSQKDQKDGLFVIKTKKQSTYRFKTFIDYENKIKCCMECGEHKSWGDFSKSKPYQTKNAAGLLSYCKPCESTRKENYNKKYCTKEKMKQYYQQRNHKTSTKL